MGLLEALLGKDNPAAMWANDNSNLLGAIGAGVAGGQNIQDGLAQGLSYAPQAKALDRQAVEKRKADALVAEQANQTSEWVKANYPQYAHLPPAQGFELAMKAEQQKYSGGGSGPTANMQDFMFGQQNPGYWEALHPPAQPDSQKAPVGYQFKEDGSLGFIPGGPADPSTPGKTTEATRRNQQLAKVIVPEMQSLQQNWSALSDLGNQAAGATGATMFASPQYQQAQNSLKTIIASYLYSVSGATANPGEVENQASILTPRVGESPLSVQAKLDRVRTMVQAVVEAAQGGSAAPGAPGDDIDAILTGLGI